MVQADEVSEDIFSFSGINGATGEYLLPEMSAAEVSKIAQGEKFDKKHLELLKYRSNRISDPEFLPKAGIYLKDIAQTGWGIIFAFNDSEKIDDWKKALKPLLDLRKKQAGNLYKEYTGQDACRPDESANDFLARHGLGPGPADPDKVPYYLLLVATPESISYRFQYQLDVQCSAGRICFDTLDEYANYAKSVVRSEQDKFPRSSKATFFGVQNPADRATKLSAMELVQPLADWMSKKKPDWSVQTLLKEEATKAKLTELLNSNDGPALLFTASHGMGFPNGDSRQLPDQGALLCQDWPGPLKWRGGAIPKDHYFCADDVSDDAKLGGMINFHFACYGAGTPQMDDFSHLTSETEEIASRAFMARLPQRLLSHPNGGTLAVIGHVERAWGCSFIWKQAGSQRTVFESALQYLAEGYPIGAAVDYFNDRYAQLSTSLTAELQEINYGKKPNDLELARNWTANNDARSYVIIGDPAVRLPTSATGVEMPAPAATSVSVQPTDASSETEPTAEEETASLNYTVTITTIDDETGTIVKKENFVPNKTPKIAKTADEDEKNKLLNNLHQEFVDKASNAWQDDLFNTSK
ncbi:MAG: hypothetical protein D3903_14520 [Candidatus Electrothrix sp. GM3_4]|nr:hypothetical protein [Candidatus Electrothrix sp. GM3_4]